MALTHPPNPEYQLILDAASVGILGLGADGKVTFCNHALLKMIGRETDEVVGKDAHKLLHHSRPDGSYYPPEECACKKALAEHRAAHFVGQYFWRKDGTSFPIEYWMRPLERPWVETCFVATIREITGVEASKEALGVNEEQYRRILTSMPDVAWTADVYGKTRYISPKIKEMLGFSNQEMYAGGTHLWLN